MDIYLDNAATTACYEEVAAQVSHVLQTEYGNPSSLHTKGMEAEKILRHATTTLAGLLKVKEKEIFYTSGGTEADNWALIGCARANARSGKHLLTTAVEHPAVTEAVKQLTEEGFTATILPVDRNGQVSAEQITEAMREDTILVSVMMINNEIGTREPIGEIGEAVHQKKADVLFHVDAVQGFGKLPVYPNRMGIDLLSASGHKIHGPKGVGFLYIREGVKIRPLLFGGGQQKNLRSGTDNVPGIAGMAKAAELLQERQTMFQEQTRRCRAVLQRGLETIEGVSVLSPEEPYGVPYILCAAFSGIRSEVLLHTLEDRGIYVSSGSACSSHKHTDSPTLTAIGCSREEQESALRFSFSEWTTEEEIETTVRTLREVVPVLRKFTRR